ncbi:MAG: hypothetical protein LBU32_02505 [Clostridiales bacterium]|nr:hypothetical protein [Clostridiales bacterium]
MAPTYETQSLQSSEAQNDAEPKTQTDFLANAASGEGVSPSDALNNAPDQPLSSQAELEPSAAPPLQHASASAAPDMSRRLMADVIESENVLAIITIIILIVLLCSSFALHFNFVERLNKLKAYIKKIDVQTSRTSMANIAAEAPSAIEELKNSASQLNKICEEMLETLQALKSAQLSDTLKSSASKSLSSYDSDDSSYAPISSAKKTRSSKSSQSSIDGDSASAREQYDLAGISLFDEVEESSAKEEDSTSAVSKEHSNSYKKDASSRKGLDPLKEDFGSSIKDFDPSKEDFGIKGFDPHKWNSDVYNWDSDAYNYEPGDSMGDASATEEKPADSEDEENLALGDEPAAAKETPALHSGGREASGSLHRSDSILGELVSDYNDALDNPAARNSFRKKYSCQSYGLSEDSKFMANIIPITLGDFDICDDGIFFLAILDEFPGMSYVLPKFGLKERSETDLIEGGFFILFNKGSADLNLHIVKPAILTQTKGVAPLLTKGTTQ